MNVAKGRWPVQNSPMTAFITGEDGRITKVDMDRLKKRQPLAEAEAKVVAPSILSFLSSPNPLTAYLW